jgi:hypothetical protein
MRAGGDRRRFVASMLATALQPLASAFASPATTTLATTKRHGLNVNELFDAPAATLPNEVARLRDLGVDWVRFDFDWSRLEPEGPQRGHHAAHERLVRLLSQAGIRVLGLITYTPPWANGGRPSKFHPPKDPAAFAGYAGRLASRYGPLGVQAWEVWNEPNLGQFWAPRPDPAAYAELLRQSYRALRRAQPEALVVSGGLAQPSTAADRLSCTEFLAAMYRAGAGGHFDALGNHAYDSPRLPNEGHNWGLMRSLAGGLRALMQQHGDGRLPIWVTEIGAPTMGRDPWGTVVDEARQALILEDAYREAARDPLLGPVFWYTLRDFCVPDPAREAECYFGLLRQDGSEKPAARAYRRSALDHQPRSR